MKTAAVFLGLLVSVLAAPEPLAQDAEFIDADIPRRGGEAAEGDAAGGDGGVFVFRIPTIRFPCIPFLGRDCGDSTDGDGSTSLSDSPFGTAFDSSFGPSFDSPFFRGIFDQFDQVIPDVKYDFENTTQEEKMIGGVLVICEKTIKTLNRDGLHSMSVSESCYPAGNTETGQEGTVVPEGVAPESDLPEVDPEVRSPDAENPIDETNEIPTGPEGMDGLRRRQRRGTWWWPLVNSDYSKHPTYTMLNLISGDDAKKSHDDSAKNDWGLRVTTAPPQAELVADSGRVIDLSGDTRVNYANRDYTQANMEEVDPDAEVFDWDLVLKEARANSYQVAPQNDQVYQNQPVSSSGAFEPIPVRSEPLRSLPMRSEPLRSLPMRSEPLRSLPMRSEPLRSLPMRSEPVRSLPMRSEPLRSLPMRSEPLRSLPMRSEPLRSHPVRYEPFVAAEPIRAHSARSEPLYSAPVGSGPLPGESRSSRYTYQARNLR